MNSSENITWQSGEYLDGQIKNGMKLKDVVAVVSSHIANLYKVTDFSCIDLHDYGITCPPDTEQGMLCYILKLTLDSQLTLSSKLDAVNRFYKEVIKSTTDLKDEKVKVSSLSTVNKYLAEALSFTPGRASIKNDVIVITGLTPVGARMMINKKRLSDIDNTGKGKVGTDLEGWALRDGRNGLDNAFGKFTLYVDDVANADKTGGADSVKLGKNHFPNFSLSVGGQIAESLLTPFTVNTKMFREERRYGIGEKYTTLIQRAGTSPNTSYPSDPLNLKHSHDFTLTAEYLNLAQDSINLVPSYVKEIPIEFIGL